MTDVATLTAQLELLRSAYRSGALRVSFDGKSTEFRDTAGMRSAISDLENEIAGLSGKRPVLTAVIRNRNGKGW